MKISHITFAALAVFLIAAQADAPPKRSAKPLPPEPTVDEVVAS